MIGLNSQARPPFAAPEPRAPCPGVLATKLFVDIYERLRISSAHDTRTTQTD